MDDFVRNQLETCGCESYVDIFRENEIDESSFRELTLDDVRQMLPNKIGPQRKIIGCIEGLKAPAINAVSFENGPAAAAVTSPSPSTVSKEPPKGPLSIQKQDPAVVAASPRSTAGTSGSSYVSPHRREVSHAAATPVSASNDGVSVGAASGTGIQQNVDSIFAKFGFKFETPTYQPKESLDGRAPGRGQQQGRANMAGHGAMLPSNHGGPSTRQFNHRGYVPPKIQKRQLKLPVSAEKERFLEVLKSNQIVIVVGETGSGKSTQIPQFLLSAGYHKMGKIGVTQPRRIATKALATRVAEELGAELGDLVGYRHRFENVTKPTTAITYMTDGILMQELALQPKVDNYSCIMIDEAHERALNTDILLGLLKLAVKKRKDLKLIVTSATLDSTKFSTYLNAAVFEIVGRGFDITTFHEQSCFTDYTLEAARKVLDIHRTAPPGQDILVFLCGQDKIELCVDKIQDGDTRRELWVLPCYSSLNSEELQLVFAPKPDEYVRKVIVATNVAETSITIDGIVYVVDSGKSKMSYYDAKTGLKTLKLVWISKAQAAQRAGRAGRTQAGIVYRLYPEYIFNQQMPDATMPEIQRSDLLHSLLLLAKHGIEDLYNFDFIDKPSQEQLHEAIQELQWLEALDQKNRLTDLGRKLARLPLNPRLAKTLLVATELGCVEDAITIVAMLQVQSGLKIYFRPKKRQYQADCRKAELTKPEGDFHTFINVYRTWEAKEYSQKWCKDYFINYKALNEVYEVCLQLREILETNKDFGSIKSSGLHDPEGVQKALIAGFFCRVAYRRVTPGRVRYGYNRTLENQDLVYIHPSSALQKSVPSWVLFDEVLQTGEKAYMMNLVEIKPAWIHEYARGFSQEFNKRFPIQENSDSDLSLDPDFVVLRKALAREVCHAFGFR